MNWTPHRQRARLAKAGFGVRIARRDGDSDGDTAAADTRMGQEALRLERHGLADRDRQSHDALGHDVADDPGPHPRPRRAARPDGTRQPVVPGAARARRRADRPAGAAADDRRPRVRHLLPRQPLHPAGAGVVRAVAAPRAPADAAGSRPRPATVARGDHRRPAGRALRDHPRDPPRHRRRAGRGDDRGGHARLRSRRDAADRSDAARTEAGPGGPPDGDRGCVGQRRQARRHDLCRTAQGVAEGLVRPGHAPTEDHYRRGADGALGGANVHHADSGVVEADDRTWLDLHPPHPRHLVRRPARRGEELRRHHERRVPHRDHRRCAPLPPRAPRGHHEAAGERADQLPHRRRQGRGEQGRARARRSRGGRTRCREQVRRRARRRRTRPQRAVPAAPRRPRRHEPAVPGGRRGETHHRSRSHREQRARHPGTGVGRRGEARSAATRWCRQSVRPRTSRWCPTRRSGAASV